MSGRLERVEARLAVLKSLVWLRVKNRQLA